LTKKRYCDTIFYVRRINNMTKKIKLTKVESAAYGCKATYSYNGHLIEADDVCFPGDICKWYCRDIWGLDGFANLRGLRKALAAIEEGMDKDEAYRRYCWDYPY
jgi:hypothetical protein